MLPDDRIADAYSWGGYYFAVGLGINLGKTLTIGLDFNFLNSGIDTDYQYGGYWQYWNEYYKTKLITLSIGYQL
jgi:hypothetical protein